MFLPRDQNHASPHKSASVKMSERGARPPKHPPYTAPKQPLPPGPPKKTPPGVGTQTDIAELMKMPSMESSKNTDRFGLFYFLSYKTFGYFLVNDLQTPRRPPQKDPMVWFFL